MIRYEYIYITDCSTITLSFHIRTSSKRVDVVAMLGKLYCTITTESTRVDLTEVSLTIYVLRVCTYNMLYYVIDVNNIFINIANMYCRYSRVRYNLNRLVETCHSSQLIQSPGEMKKDASQNRNIPSLRVLSIYVVAALRWITVKRRAQRLRVRIISSILPRPAARTKGEQVEEKPAMREERSWVPPRCSDLLHAQSVHSAAEMVIRSFRASSIDFEEGDCDLTSGNLLFCVARGCTLHLKPKSASANDSPSSKDFLTALSNKISPTKSASALLWHNQPYSLDVFGYELVSALHKYFIYLIKKVKLLQRENFHMKASDVK